MMDKRGQVTVFVIIAIVIIVGIVGYFVLKDRLVSSEIPANLEPVYTTFLQCLEDDTLTGIDVLESQGGYIELPEFETGSAYMPFGSHLDFVGNSLPYWYYISGNNIEKEQVPSVKMMEDELEGFISEEVRKCVFDSYYEQGFEINQGEPEVDVDIGSDSVRVNLGMNLNIIKGDENVVIGNHKIEVDSNLGKLYESSREIYDYEQNSLFLEEYAIDVLRLYAPVDGVELTCSPLTWNADEVFKELKSAIESNTASMKTKGGDYSIDEEDRYFIVDLDVGSDVRFLNSKNWSSSFEVTPSVGNILISNPVGNQEGLGVLGFCYVPYHFVYDVRYPVLIQVYDGEEIFQFPVAVVIENNNPRESNPSEAVEYETSDICEYKNTEVQVLTYDSKSQPVDAEISFECFGESCMIGETDGGVLSSEFPQCVNGYIVAEADGYRTEKKTYESLSEGSVEVFLDKIYDLDVSLKVDGRAYAGEAIITFISGDDSQTIIYPDTKSVELSEGQYEISVYVYEESSLKLESSSEEYCVEIPREGVGALFGLTDEKCYEMEVPGSVVSNTLSGGGKQSHYIIESDLENSDVVEIKAESLATPRSIDDLQNNYIQFESKGLDILFK